MLNSGSEVGFSPVCPAWGWWFRSAASAEANGNVSTLAWSWQRDPQCYTLMSHLSESFRPRHHQTWSGWSFITNEEEPIIAFHNKLTSYKRIQTQFFRKSIWNPFKLSLLLRDALHPPSFRCSECSETRNTQRPGRHQVWIAHHLCRWSTPWVSWTQGCLAHMSARHHMANSRQSFLTVTCKEAWYRHNTC